MLTSSLWLLCCTSQWQVFVCVGMSVRACACTQHSRQAQALLNDGAIKGTSARRWKTAVQFHTSSHALCTYTLFSLHSPLLPPPPSLSKPNAPLSPLNIHYCLLDRSLLGFFHIHQGGTHIHTHKLNYSLFWPRPLGWVNISIIYCNSPTTQRAGPAGDWATCRHNNNSNELLSVFLLI